MFPPKEIVWRFGLVIPEKYTAALGLESVRSAIRFTVDWTFTFTVSLFVKAPYKFSALTPELMVKPDAPSATVMDPAFASAPVISTIPLGTVEKTTSSALVGIPAVQFATSFHSVSSAPPCQVVVPEKAPPQNPSSAAKVSESCFRFITEKPIKKRRLCKAEENGDQQLRRAYGPFTEAADFV